MSYVIRLVCLLAVLGDVAVLRAQTGGGDGDSRGPRFLLASAARGAPPLRATATQVPVLRRRLSLALEGASLGVALATIAQKAGLRLMYSDAVIPEERVVHLKAESITVAAALTEVLLDADVDIVFERGERAMLVRRDAPVSRALASGAIVGRVSDVKTGERVYAAEVWLNGTRWRTKTDTGGWYRLTEVDTGAYTLSVRRLGYTKWSRAAVVRNEKQDTLHVALEPAPARLDELVSTATGPRRRLDVANDITTINADSVMQAAPIRSVTDLLETRVPGLMVQRTSGAPGDPARLRLRGAGSPLQNNDPIVVVDGVRMYARQSDARSTNLAGNFFGGSSGSSFPQQVATPSPLDYIDPNSIDKIEVLKGPSAATLYGQDAANGVIVITTKRGKAGPTRWTASAEQGRTTIPGEFPDLLLRWGHLLGRSGSLVCPVGNVVSGLGVTGGAFTCSADSVVQFQLLNDPDLTVIGTGHRSTLSLGASGGSNALTYSVTGSYAQEVGLPKLPPYEAARYETRLGTSPLDWMQRPQHLRQWGVVSSVGARLGATADLSLTTNFSSTLQGRSSLDQQLGFLMGTYIDRASGTYYTGTGGTLSAPLSVTDGLLKDYYQRATAGATQFTNSVTLNWRPQSWFTVNADAGLNLIHRADELFFPHGVDPADTVGHLNVGQGTSVVSTVNLRGNVQVPLRHGFLVRVAGGANYAGTSINDQSLATSFLPAGTSLQGSVISGGSRGVQNDATFGWYVEPSIGNSRFNFSSGLRLDGGGSYGSNVSGLSLPKFPKLGLSYLLSEEPWFPFKEWVQSLRVRISYGRASRQPGVTDRLRLYDAAQPIPIDGVLMDGVYLQSFGNTKLRPERSTEVEGGFDVDLLDNRLTVSVTRYQKVTDDALLPKPVPLSVYGGGTTLTNIGRIQNTGFEMDLEAQILRTGFINWHSRIGLSQDRNLVVNLGKGVDPFYTDGGNATDGGTRVAPGYPLFGRWTRPILGYADGNGNRILEPAEILIGDTAVYVGQTIPNYQLAFSTSLTLWHGAIKMNAEWAYQNGLSQRNEVARGLAPFSLALNDSTSSLAEQAAVSYNIPTDYNWIQTVNTLQFRSVTVAYGVPSGVAKRLGAQTIDVSIQGGNLGLWTNYRGLDPNVNSRVTGNGVADTGVLPQPRTWQLRFSATY